MRMEDGLRFICLIRQYACPTRTLGTRESGQILGASLAISNAESMAHWLALAISQKLTLDACLEQPFYHPVLEEILREALQDCLAHTELGLPTPPGLLPAVTILPKSR